MSCRRTVALFCSFGVLSVACKEDPPASEQRTEPWPAPAASSAALPASSTVSYRLSDKQRIDFELKTKSTRIVGYFPVLKGNLQVDLMHLERSKGSVEMDLAAVRIESEDEQEHRSYSATASNWLNLGASIPEAKRASRRWASFEIGEVFEVSSEAAHEGRRERREKKSPDENTDADAGAPTGELRKVFAKLRGPFAMNQRRMSQDVHVALSFSYPAEATPGFPPDQVQVKSSRDLRIALEAYGVKPRNSQGIVVSSDLKELGSTVSRIARVSFALTFERASGDQ